MSDAARAPKIDEPPLEVTDLSVRVRAGRDSGVDIVTGVSFALKRRRTLGLVGESGSGKSLTALALMGLLDDEALDVEGSVRLNGRELTTTPRRRLADLRGREIAMIFQEPQSSLNPAFTVGDQIAETVRRHEGLSRRAARDRAVTALGTVGISSPRSRAKAYPHMLSGGMLQRVMLAMALVCEPSVLIADEPTTSLDVTIQAQILELMRDLQERMGMAMLLVTHDMGVVADACDEVAVMYAGEIVEHADALALFDGPKHPYTHRLLAAVPKLDVGVDRLAVIEGKIPAPGDYPHGCRFAPRCAHTRPPVCHEPQELRTRQGRLVRCARAEQLVLGGQS